MRKRSLCLALLLLICAVSEGCCWCPCNRPFLFRREASAQNDLLPADESRVGLVRVASWPQRSQDQPHPPRGRVERLQGCGPRSDIDARN